VRSSVAAAIVFVTSAAVLVLEILAGRLLAPYTGVTMETYSAIIGVALAGIAGGTWLGGWAADRGDPDRLLGPLVTAGGALTMATVPLARAVGGSGAGEGAGEVIFLAVVTLLAPAGILSAVSPAIVKLQLRDLAQTGQVVGRLSAIGTAGAILGTFAAGFVLVELAPTSTTIVALGAALVVAGLVLWLWRSRLSAADAALVAGGIVAVGMLTAASSGPCEAETRYHCARVVEDPARASGRTLWLDTLQHSYIDLDDPTHLEFRYTKVVGDVIDFVTPADDIDVLHVGGGGFTLPRALEVTRPASQHTVLEVDDRLVDLVRAELGLRDGGRITVQEGDARTLVRDLADGSFDVVVGDAFGGLAVPWHLTTLEFAQDVRRVMAPEGVYVVNLIDYPPLRFARAELVTLSRVFPHVALLAPAPVVEGRSGSNVVLVGSLAPLSPVSLSAQVAARNGTEMVLVDAAAISFAGDAPVLTDDHAPVDQWLARSER
jgi:spermidine synthase